MNEHWFITWGWQRVPDGHILASPEQFFRSKEDAERAVPEGWQVIELKVIFAPNR